MADGRVIAYGASDTASGAFTCVVRRAGFPNRLTYRIHFENNSDGRANVDFFHGGDAVQTMLVSARSRADVKFTLPEYAPAPIVVEIRCDGSTMRVLGYQQLPDPSRARRHARMALIAVALAGAGVAALVAVLWPQFLRRRNRPPVPPFVPEPTAEPVEDAVTEPAPAEAPEQPGAVNPPAVQVLDPEIVRHRVEHATVGITYDARPVGEPAPLRSVIPVVIGAIVIVTAYVFAHPHVGDVGAPNEVVQGSALDVPYTASGLGTLRYHMATSSGAVLAEGDLAAHAGTLHLSIPSGPQDETYRLRLMLDGPLGDASNEATISAVAVPRARIITRVPAVPTIRSFAVTRSVANNASSVIAFYDVQADRGTVRLLDSRGIQYGAASLDASGQARFALPDGVDPGTLAVELRAVRGGVVADSRIALPTTQNGVTVAAHPASAGDTADNDTAPIVVPATSVGGTPIRVRIVHHYEGLHLALIDGNARKITGATVPRSARVVALAHSAVAVATRVTVQATYRVNDESDTVIRSVILLPAGG